MTSSHLIDYLITNHVKYECNVNLSEFTYFRTGGTAKIIIFPNTINSFVLLIKEIRKISLKFKIIGDTSNLLFLDNTSYSCLISVKLLNKILFHNPYTFEADCGVTLPDLSRFALQHNLAGFAGLEGIPGRLGGAIFMNAGAYGDEISDNLISVDVLDTDLKIVNIVASDLNFSYRNSIFKSNPQLVILKAFFKCTKTNRKVIYDNMSLYHSKRHKYQEFCYPSLGSIFSCSLYRVLARKNFFFGIISRLYFLFNYKIKLHRRESPSHRRLLNNLALRTFNIKLKTQSFSDKDLNTLINKGQGTDEILKYINKLKKIVGSNAPIENEIVEKF